MAAHGRRNSAGTILRADAGSSERFAPRRCRLSCGYAQACRDAVYDRVRWHGPDRRMTTSSLDTLDIARRLKSVGFNDAQAEAVTEIIRNVRTADLANLATKADIGATRAD